MPSKIQMDENLWFLFICLQKSDYKVVGADARCSALERLLNSRQIDFAAVGEAAGLKAPAARMRFTRLKRQIQEGKLVATQCASLPAQAETRVSTPCKRPKPREEELVAMKRPKTRGVQLKVKTEYEGTSDDSGSDSDYVDSEDEIPLAQRHIGRHRVNTSQSEPTTLLQQSTSSARGQQQDLEQLPERFRRQSLCTVHPGPIGNTLAHTRGRVHCQIAHAKDPLNRSAATIPHGLTTLTPDAPGARIS